MCVCVCVREREREHIIIHGIAATLKQIVKILIHRPLSLAAMFVYINTSFPQCILMVVKFVTPRSFTEEYSPFGRTCCLYSTVKLEIQGNTENLVFTSSTVWSRRCVIQN